ADGAAVVVVVLAVSAAGDRQEEEPAAVVPAVAGDVVLVADVVVGGQRVVVGDAVRGDLVRGRRLVPDRDQRGHAHGDPAADHDPAPGPRLALDRYLRGGLFQLPLGLVLDGLAAGALLGQRRFARLGGLRVLEPHLPAPGLRLG